MKNVTSRRAPARRVNSMQDAIRAADAARVSSTAQRCIRQTFTIQNQEVTESREATPIHLPKRHAAQDSDLPVRSLTQQYTLFDNSLLLGLAQRWCGKIACKLSIMPFVNSCGKS